MGTTDASITGVEAISASTAAGGVTITLSGQSESFTITGSASADTLTGGTGADTIIGGAGINSLAGGTGVDTFVVNAVVNTSSDSNTAAKDTITDFLPGTDFILIKATNVNNFSVVSNVTAGNSSGNYSADLNNNGNSTDVGDVQLTSAVQFGNGSNAGGGARAATIVDLTGTSGSDTLGGGTNNDTFTGGAGADTITTGAGNDTIVENAGASAVTLGNSGNTGTISGYDVITDFSTINDTLDLAGTLSHFRMGPRTATTQLL